LAPFHLAIPVNDLEKAREFYGGIFGLEQGREQIGKWIDYNFFGHQLVCHFTAPDWKPAEFCNYVDKYDVPVPHFGVCMTVENWQTLRDKLIGAKIKFIVEPHLRFEGQPGEQWTMFFKDPSGNNLEFKAMTNPNNLFAKYIVQV
jgi:extradiol dioxygenase family protein